MVIEANATEDHVVCKITNHGKGIPQNELETVFDKFAQSSKTRTGAGGTGLGACVLGVPPDRPVAVRDASGVPEEQLSVGVISLGWPAADERPIGSPRRRARRTHDELIHREAW